MADIFDYFNWRGDLPLKQAPLNNVDALILSRLSYLPFDDIVPAEPWQSLSIAQAAARFFALPHYADIVNMAMDVNLLRELSRSQRFKDMRLSAYVSEIDHKTQKQFAALVIELGDGAHFISYRGTDNTLVGWKEDFNMTFMTPVPSQEAAVVYLDYVERELQGPIYLGGHSKGGNLAVYAAAFCRLEVQERIVVVFNNDGPGLDSAVISEEGFSAVRNRIRTFVPQSSVVGMLLEHEEEYQIIHSKQKGLLQHDMYSWEVLRDNFICLEKATSGSRFLDRTLKDWMSSVQPEQREQFIDAVYSVFQETQAETLKELTANWYKNALAALKSLKNMDESVRHFTAQTLFLLIKSAKRNLRMLMKKDAEASAKSREEKTT